MPDDWTLTPTSSHVAAVTWEEDGVIEMEHGEYPYGTLYVAFKSGAVYSYRCVSKVDYGAILAAKSKGRALYRLGITNPDSRKARRFGTLSS